MEDKELIREIHKGKKEYLNDIAGKYYDDIYRFCCYQTGDREQSYDLAQETFLKLIRYVDNYRFQNLKGYLLTIARNVCNDYFREKNSRLVSMEEAELEQLTGGEKNRDSETMMSLQEALGFLDKNQREAILLHYVYHLKYREIARITETNSSTVKSRVKQGTGKLQKILKKEDFYG